MLSSASLKYLPFLNGQYSTKPGLLPLRKAERPEDRLVFQIDEQYKVYMENKDACRRESIHKYYKEQDFLPETAEVINAYIMQQLVSEYPDYFTVENGTLQNHLVSRLAVGAYLSRFDALCSQVQEDMAVVQLTDDTEHLAAIHLCSPNHWSPADKIGKSFTAIHAPVADMQATLANYRPMLESIVKRRAAFTRFAWGIGTDDRLNHHPEAPVGEQAENWGGRSSSPDRLFVRVERQNLIGFPEVNALLFTIKTYHYPVKELSSADKLKLGDALKSMSPPTISYKGLDQSFDQILSALKV